MISRISKYVISFPLRSNSQCPLQKTPFCFSISFHFFSSSPPNVPKSKPAIGVAEFLINQHQFSSEAALKASSTFAYMNKPHRSDLVLSFLKKSGFSQTHLEETVTKRPAILSVDLDKSIKPKIKIFQDLGFSPTDIAQIISADPWILSRSLNNRFRPSILVLKRVLGSNADVCKALKLYGGFLKHDLEKTMMPNIELLKSCGISFNAIVKFVFHFPRFFLFMPQSIMDYVKRVEEMGFDRSSKMFLPAIRVLSSMTMENWELKLELFRGLGFSENDILFVFRRMPHVFNISKKKFKEMTELLLVAGNHNISSVVKYPEVLTYSIERRVKPRLEVLEILEKRKILTSKPCLAKICKLTDKQFSEKYVIPYANEPGKQHVATGR